MHCDAEAKAVLSWQCHCKGEEVAGFHPIPVFCALTERGQELLSGDGDMSWLNSRCATWTLAEHLPWVGNLPEQRFKSSSMFSFLSFLYIRISNNFRNSPKHTFPIFFCRMYLFETTFSVLLIINSNTKHLWKCQRCFSTTIPSIQLWFNYCMWKINK